MPELLLSSLPAKEISSQSMKGVSMSSQIENGKADTSASIDGLEQRGFTKVLSSLVEDGAKQETSQLDTESKKSLEDLSQLLKDLKRQFSGLQENDSSLAAMGDWLNRQDLSLDGLTSLDMGGKLPDLIASLDTLLQQELGLELDGLQLEDLKQLNIDLDNLTLEDAESLENIQVLLAQLFQAMQSFSKQMKSASEMQEAKPALLGFAFNAQHGPAKENKWQHYDPQQLSQSVNRQTGTEGLSLDGQMLKPQTEQLLSKSDQSFQLQMEQLSLGGGRDSASLAETTLETLVDIKEKPASKFSDIQLRATPESLKQYSTTLSTPVSAQEWGEEVSQKIVWFTGRNIQAAEMHLNPAELGPIDVKINVQNDVASVTFNVNNASVRDLLESNVVRLREMMEANGVNVGDVNVDAGSQEEPHGFAQQSSEAGFGRNGADGDEDLSEEQQSEQVVNIKETNLVDYFV
ncbi:MAG: flagellar hook-length control protein FliK [Oleiphilus sp.]